MTNNIYELQNDEDMLKCLAAQRSMYDKAKSWGLSECICAIVYAVVSCISAYVSSDVLNAMCGVFGISFLIFGNRIERIIREYCRKAAGIQQYFDSRLFSAVSNTKQEDWNNVPLLSEIEESKCEVSDYKDSKLKNWYSDYSKCSYRRQILSCQQENIRWDKDLKLRIKNLMLVFFFIVAVIVIVGCVCNHVTILLFLCHISFVLPIGEYCYNFYQEKKSEIDRLCRLDSFAKEIEKQIETVDVNRLIDLQCRIMEHRIDSVPISNKIYVFFRKKMQKKEDSIAVGICKNGGVK